MKLLAEIFMSDLRSLFGVEALNDVMFMYPDQWHVSSSRELGINWSVESRDSLCTIFLVKHSMHPIDSASKYSSPVFSDSE